MEFTTYLKFEKIAKAILTPFLILYFIGFIGVRKFNSLVFELHNKAIKEDRDNVWFAKKCIALYLRITFTTLLNLFMWIGSIYLMLK